MDLDIEVAKEGDVCVLDLRGEVDVYTSPALKERLHEAVGDGCVHIVVDLADVQFMDSSGLGALVSGLRRTKESSGSVRLVQPREQILKVFRITGLDKVFPIHESLEEARATLA